MTFILKSFWAKFLVFDRKLFREISIPNLSEKEVPLEMEVWRGIPSFPGSSVSNEGRVRNDKTGHVRILLMNSHGIVNVGLYRDNVQHRRSVAVLVAEAFLPRPKLAVFNTPIHLNGDRTDIRADNLELRPLWFARAYHMQFSQPRRGLAKPIEDTATGECFKNSWEAAIKFGLLDREILLAVYNRTYVFPTLQIFRLV